MICTTRSPTGLDNIKLTNNGQDLAALLENQKYFFTWIRSKSLFHGSMILTLLNQAGDEDCKILSYGQLMVTIINT